MVFKKIGIDFLVSCEWWKFVLNVIKKFMEFEIDVLDVEVDELKILFEEDCWNMFRSLKKVKINFLCI